LVLDEPLTFLDVRQQLELLQVLKNLSSQGKTILLIVHDLHTALTFADNMIVLSGGSLAAEGQPGLIAENGIIDRVFGIHTEKITAPGGRPVYTFTGGDLL
jgi:iron complex transport system ATP-binding protein